MPLIQPSEQIAYWVIPSLELDGYTPLGNATGINNDLTDVIYAEGEQAFLAAAQGNVGTYKPLPDVGQLVEAGEIYGYNGGLVICRQSHARTIHPPEDTLALFVVYRPDGGGVLDWVAGERVEVGTHRIYNTIEYVCIQAHVTQSDWTPPAVPALWQVYMPPSADWQAGVAYKIGDEVMYQGVLYRCRQSHTSQVGWEPPRVPALWLQI